MNKITMGLLIVITALSLSLAVTRQSKAQDRSFSGIMPFITSNDRVGFLDQGNGRIYIYDSNLSQCLFVGQLDSLGKPIQVLSNTPTSNTNE